MRDGAQQVGSAAARSLARFEAGVACCVDVTLDLAIDPVDAAGAVVNLRTVTRYRAAILAAGFGFAAISVIFVGAALLVGGAAGGGPTIVGAGAVIFIRARLAVETSLRTAAADTVFGFCAFPRAGCGGTVAGARCGGVDGQIALVAGGRSCGCTFWILNGCGLGGLGVS